MTTIEVNMNWGEWKELNKGNVMGAFTEAYPNPTTGLGCSGLQN